MKDRKAIKISLLLASSLTVMSGALIAPALPQMAEVFADVPHAPFLTKLILTTPAVFIAALSPLAGWLIDRFGKMKLFVGSMLLYALAGSAGFVLSDLYLILVSRAVLGVAVAGIMTTATTLIGDYLEGEERRKFLGTQSAFMAFGGTVFVTIAGLLADISWRYPFLVYLLALAVIVMAQRYLYEPRQAAEKDSPLQQAHVGHKKWIMLVYAATLLGMLMFYMIPVQSPFLLQRMGVESSFMGGMGVITATLFAALSGQNYAFLRRHISYLMLYCLTFGLMAAGYGITFLAEGFWQVMGGMVLSGLGAGLLMPNANLWLIELVPPQARGRVIGGLTSAVFLGQFLSPVVVQPLVRLTSLPAAYGLAAAFMLLLTFTFLAIGLLKQKKSVAALL